MYRTLVSTAIAARHAGNPKWRFVDCRFSLKDTDLGRRDYLKGHIPGAVYGHLNDDLSGEIIPGVTGRHPLPAPANFIKQLSAWGIDASVQVVVYDAAGGGIAARLWWMLRWMGHDAVAVLDGGWGAWLAEGCPVSTIPAAPERRSFTANPRPNWSVSAGVVDDIRKDSDYRLIDARAPERYRGETEPLDVLPGHIPGAVNLPYSGNLDDRNRFLPPQVLGTRYARILGDIPVKNVVCYCGSGVTACHDLLAMAHAGLGDGKLYAGSWSDWITDRKRERSL